MPAEVVHSAAAGLQLACGPLLILEGIDQLLAMLVVAPMLTIYNHRGGQAYPAAAAAP